METLKNPASCPHLWNRLIQKDVIVNQYLDGKILVKVYQDGHIVKKHIFK